MRFPDYWPGTGYCQCERCQSFRKALAAPRLVERPKAEKEGVRVKLAKLIAHFAHAVVTEFRELEAEPEAEKNPTGFSLPTGPYVK